MSYKGFGFDTKNGKTLPALILIGIGVLGLVAGVGLFRFLGGFIWAAVFGALAYYAYTEGSRRGNDLWRIAAFPLAGLAIAAIMPGSYGGGAFLAAVGLAFALVWRNDRRRWWAMIPAGTFASLAAVSFFEPVLGGAAGWLFLAGLAATFYALTRFEVEPQPWAIYPAVVLGIVAVLSFATSGSWVVPLLFIGAGLFLLVRSGVITLPAKATADRPAGPAEQGEFLTTVPAAPPVEARPTGAPEEGTTAEVE